MLKYSKPFFTFVIALFITLNAHSQQTKVRGVVIDGETKETLPFVNIVFKNTTIGTITDFDGNYFIQSTTKTDTLEFSMIGYETVYKVIKRNTYQELNIELEPSDVTLNEIVVKPGENPAWRIMRNIVAKKKENNPYRFEGYQFESYNKIQMDINNVDDKFRNRKVFNNFEFVFQFADTSAETGKAYLPMLISESVSDFYYQKRPFKKKEIIKATQISGVENNSISQYTGQMYVDVNVYDNFFNLFTHEFTSPFSDFWKLTYKYYLLDSTYINGKYCYHISFRPRRKQEFTFTGEFWVHDTTFAIQKIKARISDGINLNYVNDLIVEQEFDYIDSCWFLARENVFVDFNITDRTTGFFGRKYMSRRNIKINPKYPDNFFASDAPEESIVLDNSKTSDTTQWNQLRHVQLSEKEQDIYIMVDSVKNVPIFRSFVDIINLLTVGYYVHNWWEFGPYFKTYSFNPIEGHRIRFGGRTSNQFSTKLMLYGHVAYGTSDKMLKYRLGTLYMFNKLPRRALDIQYKYDIEQLGQSVNAFTEDNILATILSRTPNDNLLMVNDFKINYEHEWHQGFANTFHVNYKRIYPSQKIPFENTAANTVVKYVQALEFSVNTHFAYNEKFVMGEFERISLGSEYPTLDLKLVGGIQNKLKPGFEYFRAVAVVSHHFDINPFGEFQYKIEIGKLLGHVPFPLLKLHEGNETYAFDSYAFNMMNFYEFASDTYTSLYIEHHFQGFFLNKLPFLRKLKLREVLYGKGLIGQISDKNSRAMGILDFPATLTDVNKPYFEAGFGIENILKVFRIDAIWRFSYLDKPDVVPFGIRAKIQIIL